MTPIPTTRSLDVSPPFRSWQLDVVELMHSPQRQHICRLMSCIRTDLDSPVISQEHVPRLSTADIYFPSLPSPSPAQGNCAARFPRRQQSGGPDKHRHPAKRKSPRAVAHGYEPVREAARPTARRTATRASCAAVSGPSTTTRGHDTRATSGPVEEPVGGRALGAYRAAVSLPSGFLFFLPELHCIIDFDGLLSTHYASSSMTETLFHIFSLVP